MLTYHPAFDTYHCVLRILRILAATESHNMELDRVRICDYYLCVPSALRSFKFPRNLLHYKKVFSSMVNQYNDVPNQRSLFFDLKKSQDASINQLVSIGVIDHELYHSGLLSFKENIMQERIIEATNSATSINDHVAEFVLKELSKIPLLGKDGLKHRSGLMEHRYDLV